jgi:hypothetical protein
MPCVKDDNIRQLPYLRWEGPTTPTFLPPSKPEQAPCVDHLAIWDTLGLITQVGPKQAIATSFLDHNGVLGRASLPLFIAPVTPILKTARTPQVPTLNYPIPSHTLAAWKSQVAVDSHSPTSLTLATANVILTGLEDTPSPFTTADLTGPRLGDRDSILSLATYLQNIFGEAMHMAMNMFPLKAGTPGKGNTLHHHIWPKSSMHVGYAVRNRTKALRHLAALTAATAHLTLESLADVDSPHHKLWPRVANPFTSEQRPPPPRSGTKRP